MSYNYVDQRPNLFTESGQVMFLKIRDHVQYLLKTSGAVRLQEAISGCTGDSWDMLACMDRLVELEEIVELLYPLGPPAGQYRVFVKRW